MVKKFDHMHFILQNLYYFTFYFHKIIDILCSTSKFVGVPELTRINVPDVYSLNTKNTRWPRWLRHCVTSRKIASSIPSGVIGIFSST